MKNYIFFDKNGATYRRITKQNARRAYDKGVKVYLAPCNLHPFFTWGAFSPLAIENNKDVEIVTGDGSICFEPSEGFDKIVNAFAFYKCTNAETGRQVNYYVEKEGGKE